MATEATIRLRRERVNRAEYIAKASEAKRVLDIGCLGGRGLISRMIRQNAMQYVGIDIEEGQGVVRADAQDFQLNTVFDVVVAGEIIEHLANPAGMLESCMRHLVAGGRLIVTTPNAFSLLHMLQAILRGRVPNEPSHIALFDMTTLANFIRLVGKDRLKGDLIYYEEIEPELLLYKVNRFASAFRPSFAIGLLADLRYVER